MNIVGVAANNLRQRRVRSLLTTGGVAIAIAAFVAFIGLSRGIENTLRRSLDTRGADIIIVETVSEDYLSSVGPQELVDRVREEPLVVAAAPELDRMTTLADGTNVFVVAWPEDAFGWRNLTLVEGRPPTTADDGGVVVGTSLAERLGIRVGDTVDVFFSPFRVVGIVDSGNVINRNLIVGLLVDMQALTYRTGQATSIVAQLSPDAGEEGREAAVERLRAILPTYTVATTEALISSSMHVNVARVLAWSISTVALLTAVLAILNTMTMAVNERRREIAIMRAVGWPKRRIVACLLIEGGLLSALGGAIGCATGTAIAWTVSGSPNVSGFVVPDITAILLAEAFLIALAMGVLSSLVPAWSGARQSPAAVLRGH